MTLGQAHAMDGYTACSGKRARSQFFSEAMLDFYGKSTALHA